MVTQIEQRQPLGCLAVISLVAGLAAAHCGLRPNTVAHVLEWSGAKGVAPDFVIRNVERYNELVVVLGGLLLTVVPLLLIRSTRMSRLRDRLASRLDEVDRHDVRVLRAQGRMVVLWGALCCLPLLPVLMVACPIAAFSLDDYPIERCLQTAGLGRSLLIPHLGHVMPGYRLEVGVANLFFGTNPGPRAVVAWLMTWATLLGFVLVLRSLSMSAAGIIAAVAAFTVWTGFTSVCAGFFAASPYMQVLGTGLWSIYLVMRFIRQGRPFDLAASASCVLATLLLDNAGFWLIPCLLVVGYATVASSSQTRYLPRYGVSAILTMAIAVVIGLVNYVVLSSGSSRSDLLAAGQARSVWQLLRDMSALAAHAAGGIAFGPIASPRLGQTALASVLCLVAFVAIVARRRLPWHAVLSTLACLLVCLAFVAVGRPGIADRGANTQHLWLASCWLCAIAGWLTHGIWLGGLTGRRLAVELLAVVLLLSTPVRVLGWLSAKSDYAYRRNEADAVRRFRDEVVLPLAEIEPHVRVLGLPGHRLCQTVSGLAANPYDLHVYSPFLRTPNISPLFVEAESGAIGISGDLLRSDNVRSAVGDQFIRLAGSSRFLSHALYDPIDLALDRHPFTPATSPVREGRHPPANAVIRSTGATPSVTDLGIELESDGTATVIVRSGQWCPSDWRYLRVSVGTDQRASARRVQVAYECDSEQQLGASWIRPFGTLRPTRSLVLDMHSEPSYVLSRHIRNLSLRFPDSGRYVVREAILVSARSPAGGSEK